MILIFIMASLSKVIVFFSSPSKSFDLLCVFGSYSLLRCVKCPNLCDPEAVCGEDASEPSTVWPGHMLLCQSPHPMNHELFQARTGIYSLMCSEPYRFLARLTHPCDLEWMFQGRLQEEIVELQSCILLICMLRLCACISNILAKIISCRKNW
jgi:hypothetical protein